MTIALRDFRIEGIKPNVPLLLWIAQDEAYRNGDTTTSFLAERLDESIFAKREIDATALAHAAAEILRDGRAPWRMNAVGIPLRLQFGERVYAIVANRNASDTAWTLSGDLNGELSLTNGVATFDGAPLHGSAGEAFRLADPPAVDEAAAHHGAGGADGRITSPMPGKIVKIAAREGDTVKAHDLLLVLEAMKMEHRIEAPGDGTVKTLFVSEGQLVGGSAPLVEIE